MKAAQRQTCLKRPERNKFYSIQHHHVRLFGGDESLAKILGALDALTAWKMPDGQCASARTGEHWSWGPWIEVSIRKIASHFANTIGKTTIIAKLKILESVGVIDKRETPGKKTQYRLHIALLDEWCAKGYVIPKEYLNSSKTTIRTRPALHSFRFASEPVAVQNHTGDQHEAELVGHRYIGSNNKSNTIEYFSNRSTAAEEECSRDFSLREKDSSGERRILQVTDNGRVTNITSHHDTSLIETGVKSGKGNSDSVYSIPQPSSPANGIPDSALQLGNPAATFVRDTFARARCGEVLDDGRVGSPLVRFAITEHIHGAAVVRRELLAFVAEIEDVGLRGSGCPLSLFLEHFSASHPPSPRPETPESSAFRLDLLAAIWNALVPARPVHWPAGQNAKYAKSIESNLSAELFRDLCAKAEKLISGNPKKFGFLTFHWFIGEKDGIANWTKLANNSFGQWEGESKKNGDPKGPTAADVMELLRKNAR